MSVSASNVVQWSPFSTVTKDSSVPIARFAAINTVTGDGSGGAVTMQYYLNDTSASLSNQNVHYVVTQFGIYVGNTGVAYKAVLYAPVTNIIVTPEGLGDAIDKYHWEDSLVDNGVSCTKSYRDVIYVGHELDNATDCLIDLIVTTNTNTKVYSSYIRGYKFYGFPVIRRDSFWI